MSLYLKIFIPSLLLILFFLWLFTKPLKKNSLSPRGGSRLKNFLAYLMIKSGRSEEDKLVEVSAINSRVPLEKGKSAEDYNDSFVFLGMDAEKNLIVTRLAFREDGSQGEVWIWMVLENKKYVMPVETSVLKKPLDEKIEIEDLSYTCTDKEKGTWKISYDGPMLPENIPCRIDLDYTPVSKMYHSGLHMDAKAFGKAMAEMSWSKEYFEKLRSENQCRIEQGGFLRGTISLQDKTKTMDLYGIRDHSWGKRTWSYINRYIWNVFALKDDLVINENKYNYIVFTSVKYGTTFKNLVSGWIAGPEKVVPISKATDISLLAEDGVIPEEYITEFQPKGLPVISMKIRRINPDQSWYMQNRTLEVSEAWCEVSIGDIKGCGMAEFGYAMNGQYKRK